MRLQPMLGFTPEKLPPTEDFTLPERFCLGLVGEFPTTLDTCG